MSSEIIGEDDLRSLIAERKETSPVSLGIKTDEVICKSERDFVSQLIVDLLEAKELNIEIFKFE